MMRSSQQSAPSSRAVAVKTALLSGVMSQPFARTFGYRNLFYQFNRADGVWRPNARRNSKWLTIADFIHAQLVRITSHPMSAV